MLRPDDHLSQSRFRETAREPCSAVRDHRYSPRDATIPEDRRTGCPPSVLSCTAWGFSCLAHYCASGELLPRLFTLACLRRREANSFPYISKNRRCLFCDTFRRRNFTTAAPACFTRHAAVWCSDFPPASLAAHQRSSAIGAELSINLKARKPGTEPRIHG